MMIRFLCLFAAVSPLMAATIVVSDGDFQPANWNSVVFFETNTTGTNSRQAAGGNPDAFRQLSVAFSSVAAGSQLGFNIASFGLLLTYNPSVSGAIQQLQFNYDISRVGATNLGPGIPTGLYRPLIEQGGKQFFLIGVDDSAALAAWTAFSHISLNPNDWGQINAGLEKPDFSANGGVMTFGYRVLLQLNCPQSATNGCTTASAISGIDNFSVTVTSADPVGNVPEPSTCGLVGAGVIAAAIWRRRGRARSASPPAP